jgi:hypothetical protein
MRSITGQALGGRQRKAAQGHQGVRTLCLLPCRTMLTLANV